MKTKNIFYSLFIVGLMAIFTLMVWGFNDVNVIEPTADTNYSGTLVINATVNNDSSQDFNATNATFYFYNSTNVLVYNVTVDPENADINRTFNSTIATATYLPDNTYYLHVNMTNGTGTEVAVNDSMANTTVTGIQIDNTAPLVTINTLNNTFLGSVTTSLVFNVTVTDAGAGVITTIDIQNSSEVNESASQVGTAASREFNRTVGVGELAEGGNTFTVVANDTITAANGGINSNNSEVITVWYDSTAPTVAIFTPINYSWTTDTTPNFVFNITDDNSPNATCQVILSNGTVLATNTTTLNDTQTTLTSTKTLPLGTHTWTANCTDLGDNHDMSNVNYTLDVVTAPTLTTQASNNTWVGASGTTNYTANGLIFNFSYTSEMVAGDSSKNASCDILLTNSSGEHSIGNYTDTVNGTATVIYNNVTLVEQVNHTWFINCSYNGTDIVSETRNLNADGTAPTINLEDENSGINRNWNNSWTTDTTPTLYYNFTELLSPTASCELFIDETGRGINSSLINATTQTWTNTTALGTGTKTWYVNCTDLSNNTGTSSSFVLDVVNPITVSSMTNDTWRNQTDAGNETFVFNYTSEMVATAGTGQNNASCELWIVNASNGGVFLANGINTTTLNGTSTVIRNNQTLVNGFAHNWTINCTYNGTDITQALNDDYWILNVDNATPTLSGVTTNDVTSSAATLKTTTNEISTCRYSDGNVGWDSMNTFTTTGGTTHSTGLTDLKGATGYTYYVKCRDRTNAYSNEGSASTQFNTNAEDSGSGGGGSGSGSGTSAPGDYAKEVWQSIDAGETATIEVENGAIGVTEVSFTVDATTYGAWVKVEKIDSLPSTVSAPASKVYKNVRITEMNVEKAMKGAATVDFKVAKSWLLENKVAKADVVLLRYKNDEWVELSTTMGADDGTYVHYAAETPGFSYFVIGVKGGAVELTPEEAAVEAAEGAPAEEAAVEEEKAPLMTKKAWLWLIPIVVALAVVAYLIWFRKKS